MIQSTDTQKTGKREESGIINHVLIDKHLSQTSA
jgi:hypothetical protein